MIVDRSRRCTCSGPRRACSRSIRLRPVLHVRCAGSETAPCSVPHAGDVGGMQAQLERRRRQLQTRQAFAQQHEQMSAVARWFGQRHLERRLARDRASRRQRGSCCITSVKRRTKACCAGSHSTSRASSRPAPYSTCSVVSARANSSSRLSNTGGSTIADTRIGHDAEARSSSFEQASPKRRADAGARHAAQVAQGAQAHALQRIPVRTAGTEQPDRRGLECPRVTSDRHSEDDVHAREQRRAVRGRRADADAAMAERLQRASRRCSRLGARRNSAGCPAPRGARCRAGPARRRRSLAGWIVTLGVNAERRMCDRLERLLVARAMARPSVSCGASASAVARFSPGFTPSACAAVLALTMRCASISAQRRVAAAAGPRPPASRRTTRATATAGVRRSRA